jgi:cell volume regulation protein A
MFLVDTLILVTGVLLLLGIASSKFSARIGVPVLVLFLAVGMLAGSEGIGGIEFENYQLAHGIGTLALAVILFDGGLRTPRESIRLAWKPSFVLATAGVLITAFATGAAAAWMLDLSLLEGLLLGSIVGSTDAAAVFATLRYGGVQLSKHLASTLEVESGANDPMAIFLTVGCIQVLSGEMEFGWGLLQLLVLQMSVGAIVGLTAGKAAVWLINRVNLDAAGLYPVLASACGLLAFGLAAAGGGSGFLAVYLAGIVMGNSRLVFQRGIFLFHDAAAWFGQIVMFIVLGLLSFPSRLLGVAGEGLLVAAVLIFVARPVTVAICLLPFRFSLRELTFISWVGLKGAVPITLATFPLMFQVAGANALFDIVFFVVVVSALVQGWSMPLVARWLGVDEPLAPTPPVTLEISSLRHVDGDIVDYTVVSESRAAGRLVRELALPEGVVIAMITRGQYIVPPHGKTRIEAGDHVIIVLRPETRPLVNNIFARGAIEREELPPELEFPLRANVTVGELEAFYGIHMEAPPRTTLSEFLRSRLEGEELKVGASVACGQIALSIRGMSESGVIDRVGMVILPPHETSADNEEQEAGERNSETQV